MSELNKKLFSNLICLGLCLITLYLERVIFRDTVSTGLFGMIICIVSIVTIFFVYRVSKYTTLLMEENKKEKNKLYKMEDVDKFVLHKHSYILIIFICLKIGYNKVYER